MVARPIGKANQNPILDTRTYNVEFSDGQTAELSAKVIAQNMYAMCDTEGNQYYLLLKGIVDHWKDGSAVEQRADIYVQRGSNRHIRKTTNKGWQICVEWKDGSTTWERLADVKDSNPVELADYAVAHGIENEPAFAWWVPFNLDDAINSCSYHKQTHKFGIEIPKTYEDCIRIDRKNSNTVLQDAIRKEMTKVQVAFQVLEGDSEPPPTFQQICRCHLVYDVKKEDFQRKARLVAGGHMTTSPPAYVTYAGVVS